MRLFLFLCILICLKSSAQLTTGLHGGGIVLGGSSVIGCQVTFKKKVLLCDLAYNYSDFNYNGALSEVVPSVGLAIPFGLSAFHFAVGLDISHVERQSVSRELEGARGVCLKGGISRQFKTGSPFYLDFYLESNKVAFFGVSKGGNSRDEVTYWYGKIVLGINYALWRDKKNKVPTED